jgi:hypothetical protein
MSNLALLSGKTMISTVELCRNWAPELLVHPADLHRALIEAITFGEFDQLPAGHGFLVAHPDSRVPGTSSATLLLEQVKRSVDQYGVTLAELLEVGERQEWWILHRDAVSAFAEKRRMALPSWWPATRRGELAEDNRFSPRILKDWYRDRVATWPATQQHPSLVEDVAAAKEQVGPGVTRAAVEILRRKLSPETWRAHGRRKQTRR